MRNKKSKRVFMAESLNSEKNISMILRNTQKEKYAVCLCLTGKMVKTVFPNIGGALNQMVKYRSLYKKLDVK